MLKSATRDHFMHITKIEATLTNPTNTSVSPTSKVNRIKIYLSDGSEILTKRMSHEEVEQSVEKLKRLVEDKTPFDYIALTQYGITYRSISGCKSVAYND